MARVFAGLCAALLWVGASAVSWAQSYSIDSYTVAPGGVESAPPGYRLDAMIGSWASAGPISNGNYLLSGDVLTDATPAQPPGPTLQVKLSSANTILISWPSASTGWILQANTVLASTGWTTVTGAVNDDGTRQSLVASLSGSTTFYRLQHP